MDYNILPPNDTTGALAGVVNNGRPPAEVRANAILFAAAPELLDTLAEAELVLAEKLKRLGADDPTVSPTYRRIVAALAKARGKS